MDQENEIIEAVVDQESGDIELAQGSDELVEGDEPDANVSDGGEVEEVVLAIDGESLAPDDEVGQAPKWVKELRKKSREDQRRIRELEAKLQSQAQTETPKPVELGKKPTLQDFDYDEDEFTKAVDAWVERKAKVEQQQAELRRKQEEEQREWQSKIDNYAKQKAELKFRDVEDAEHAAFEKLSQIQQGVIAKYAKNPAMVIYAIGKDPKKAEALSKITDPVEFAIAARELESKWSVTTKSRTPPPPERTLSGGSGGAISGASLEKLRERASQTGDYTEYFAAKRKMQNKTTQK